MSILAWVLLGIVAGFVASRLVSGSRGGILTNGVVGVVGALVGGGLFHFAGESGVTGFNLWSVFVAIIGSILVLILFTL